VDVSTIITALGTLAPIVTGLTLYLRHRDKVRLLKHVYDAGGAADAVPLTLALGGKAYSELGKPGTGLQDGGEGTVDDQAAQGGGAEGGAAARRPGAGGGRRSGKRRRRRQGRPPAGDRV
jgi:hypothetical protein